MLTKLYTLYEYSFLLSNDWLVFRIISLKYGLIYFFIHIFDFQPFGGGIPVCIKTD